MILTTIVALKAVWTAVDWRQTSILWDCGTSTREQGTRRRMRAWMGMMGR
ncbi:MAG: hypothetical protein QGH39_07080 [Candidatus Thermoplasmatota archaeon]|nr:hypothetical protein [Candidatus Thermoplasmatota archaeon]MDP7265307.1 hypothetical protein [Candidatus Thermoplasmatota archaeon]